MVDGLSGTGGGTSPSDSTFGLKSGAGNVNSLTLPELIEDLDLGEVVLSAGPCTVSSTNGSVSGSGSKGGGNEELCARDWRRRTKRDWACVS